MGDPVAEKSGFLRMYMSSHPDTLVAYAKWYGKVDGAIQSAEMSAIDTKSMTLTCTMKGGAKKEVRVVLDPPLAGYDDVKPRLLEMKAIAQEGLGMIKTPRITTLHVPLASVTTFILLGALSYFAYFPKESTSPLFLPAKVLYPYLGTASVWGLKIGAGLHVLEAGYTYTLCRRHQTGFALGAAYVALTLVIGMPIWQDLRKQIQSARINSVMKVE